MKLKITLSLLVMILAMSSSYASFPVQRAVTTAEVETVDSADNGYLFSPAAAQSSEKSQGIALLLLIFLGAVAAHRWYLGSPWYWNVLFILTLGGLGIWAIVDLIGIITGNYEPRNGTYKNEFF